MICTACTTVCPSRSHPTTIYHVQELSAARAYEILKRISDEDCEVMGFTVKFVRPDWMILSALPVPPPPVRPSVMMDSSARCVKSGCVGRCMEVTWKLREGCDSCVRVRWHTYLIRQKGRGGFLGRLHACVQGT